MQVTLRQPLGSGTCYANALMELMHQNHGLRACILYKSLVSTSPQDNFEKFLIKYYSHEGPTVIVQWMCSFLNACYPTDHPKSSGGHPYIFLASFLRKLGIRYQPIHLYTDIGLIDPATDVLLVRTDEYSTLNPIDFLVYKLYPAPIQGKWFPFSRFAQSYEKTAFPQLREWLRFQKDMGRTRLECIRAITLMGPGHFPEIDRFLEKVKASAPSWVSHLRKNESHPYDLLIRSVYRGPVKQIAGFHVAGASIILPAERLSFSQPRYHAYAGITDEHGPRIINPHGKSVAYDWVHHNTKKVSRIAKQLSHVPRWFLPDQIEFVIYVNDRFEKEWTQKLRDWMDATGVKTINEIPKAMTQSHTSDRRCVPES